MLTNVKAVLGQQRTFFNQNRTKPLAFRIHILQQFKKLLKQNEAKLFDAIDKDFQKSAFETYTTELSLIYHEIDLAIKKLSTWSKPKRVSSSLSTFPSKSYIIMEPLGCVLVIGAWNYPYQLSLSPVVAAIAAGNTVILKPSEVSHHSATVMKALINQAFQSNILHVIQGSIPETTEILEQKFDKIFFTGSTTVGRIVYQAAAKHLTPVVLELGGKSPTFVFSDVNLATTVKRIVWAKFLNAGQTCVAPDYIVVEKSFQSTLETALKAEINKQFKNITHRDENYMQIINDTNVSRLKNLNNKDITVDIAHRYIPPTLLSNASFDDAIMQDEIFGPILPVIGFENLDDVIATIKNRPKPLACYIYTNNKTIKNKLLSELSFGGGTINDSIMHLTNSNLPFGGVGDSGMGSYHGEYGFKTFSHQKSILERTTWFEPSIKYAPYHSWKRKIIAWLLG